MSHYFAHHAGLLASSLAEAGLVPVLVWIWILEHTDREQTVHDARPRRIANELSLVDTNIFTVEAVAEALDFLQQPDPTSKRTDHEGRRLIPHPTEGSAFIAVNFTYYNAEWAKERRRADAAARQRRYEARTKSHSEHEPDAGLTDPDAGLTDPDPLISISKKTNTRASARSSADAERVAWFEEVWSHYPRKKGHDAALRHFLKTVHSDADLGDLRTALANALREFAPRPPDKIPYGGTFFNTWRDYLEPDVKLTGNRGGFVL